MNQPWFNDGLDDEEARLVDDLGYIALKSETEALSIIRYAIPEHVRTRRCLGHQGAEPSWSISINEEGSESVSEHFQRVMAHPAISDGITDEEAKIVATLRGVSEYNPDLVNTLLDPAQVRLEERTISLPLAGEVQLTIIRTRPGAERTMDILERAVRNVEEFMGVAFPERARHLLVRRCHKGILSLGLTSRPTSQAARRSMRIVMLRTPPSVI